MAKDDELKAQRKKLEEATVLEFARMQAPWINNVRLGVTDGGTIRIAFSELDAAANKAVGRCAVNMSPQCAMMLSELIQAFVKKAEGSIQ